MKKSSLFLPVICLLATGCANDTKFNSAEDGLSDGDVKGYLSVRLVAPGNLTTRAEYQYGTAEENYVNAVRFFFFDDNGNACMVRKNPIQTDPEAENAYFSYYDWTPTPSENENGQVWQEGEDQIVEDPATGGTVEKILTTMVVLTGPETVTPTQIVAVLNPNDYVKSLPNPDLKDLQDAVKNYLDGFTASNFVMSNSVYVDEDGEEIIAQSIDKEKFKPTQPAAQEDPMIVYVERVVARLDLNLDIKGLEKDDDYATDFRPVALNDTTTLYPTGILYTSQDRKYDPEETTDDQYTDEPVYVKFLGWAVTSTPIESKLIKKINAGWDRTGFFGETNEPWYVSDYHRSFWAISQNLGKESDYKWYSYNQISGLDKEVPRTGNYMSIKKTYMNENANPSDKTEDGSNPDEPTKIIFAAQLVDKTGEPLTIADWQGIYFTLDGLKNHAADMLDMYKEDSDSPTGYTKITGDEIDFITSSEFHGYSPIFNLGNYLIYPTLAEDATKKWYHLNENVTGTSDEHYTVINDINNYMEAAFGTAMVWNNGYTYYFFPIKHLGAQDFPGELGVVRNHIYNANATLLKGLGTPVWDPNEPIYPEYPERNGNNLSAEVQVLMWRIVSDDYYFNW